MALPFKQSSTGWRLVGRVRINPCGKLLRKYGNQSQRGLITNRENIMKMPKMWRDCSVAQGRDLSKGCVLLPVCRLWRQLGVAR